MTTPSFATRSSLCEFDNHDGCGAATSCNCPCHAWDSIRRMAQTADRYIDDDMTPSLLMTANNWAASYTGTFEYVVDIRNRMRAGKYPSVAQLRGIANCMLAEERRNIAASAPALTTDGNYKAIVEFMANVPLQYPKLRMAFEGTAIRLSRAGKASKYAGAVNVTAEDETWNDRDGRMERRWLGRIELDGKLTAGKGMTNVIIGMLDALALNPAEVAAAYGKLTSRCCFCGKELSTDESLAVGYGPDCADHFGLPWGVVKAA